MNRLFLISVFLLALISVGTPVFHASLKSASADDMRLGDLIISDPWLKATQSGKPVTGGYLTIRNDGMIDDYLLEASAAFSGKTEIHEMKITNDIMQMRPLSEGLFIPAGETVMLKPGGYHVMFMGLNQPLSEEGEFEVVLNFKHAGSIRVMFDAKRNQGQTH